MAKISSSEYLKTNEINDIVSTIKNYAVGIENEKGQDPAKIILLEDSINSCLERVDTRVSLNEKPWCS